MSLCILQGGVDGRRKWAPVRIIAAEAHVDFLAVPNSTIIETSANV